MINCLPVRLTDVYAALTLMVLVALSLDNASKIYLSGASQEILDMGFWLDLVDL